MASLIFTQILSFINKADEIQGVSSYFSTAASQCPISEILEQCIWSLASDLIAMDNYGYFCGKNPERGALDPTFLLYSDARQDWQAGFGSKGPEVSILKC